MSQINFNRENVSIDLAQKVADATGISRYSQSSKMKLLIDIFSDEMSNLAETYNEAVNSIYSDTAKGTDLDVKGAEYGVYRKVRSSIYIDGADRIASIKPKTEGQVFGDTILEPITIARGEIIDVGSSFYIITSKEINIVRIESEVLVSGTIVSSTDSGFNINSGDTYEMTPRDRLSSSLSTLMIEFSKPVSIDGGVETDDEFRNRVLLARDGSNIATLSGIESAVLSTPQLNGYSILENKRGSGSLDIGIVTDRLQSTSIDPDLNSTIRSIETDLREVAPLGSDILLFPPDKLNLQLTYSTSSNIVSDNNIRDAIKEAFRASYRYKSTNSIYAADIEKQVGAVLPEVSIIITNMDLYDETISAVISSSSNMVVAGAGYYIFLEEDGINREQND